MQVPRKWGVWPLPPTCPEILLPGAEPGDAQDGAQGLSTAPLRNGVRRPFQRGA